MPLSIGMIQTNLSPYLLLGYLNKIWLPVVNAFFSRSRAQEIQPNATPFDSRHVYISLSFEHKKFKAVLLRSTPGIGTFHLVLKIAIRIIFFYQSV